MKTSRIPKFYNLSIDKRLAIVKEFANLTDEDVKIIRNTGNLGDDLANIMIENVIGGITYPLSVAVNFRINGKDYVVPMALEEPSVVAAASNAARAMRKDRGIISIATEPIMIGQIQVVDVLNPYYVKMMIIEHKKEIIDLANEQDPTLVSLGGGAKDIEVRIIDSAIGPMVIIHLLVDVRDAMGANAVNSMCEKVADYIEDLTKGRVYLRIISNLADKRLVRSYVKVYKEDIGGEEVVDGIITAWAFADADPYRAATHNKGILNGVIAVALATCQDHRAIEAAAHSYAARFGWYSPLSTWEKDEDGNLIGTLEMPMPVGTVGGATRVHPVAKVSLKILGIKSAKELAEIMGSVGLAQNFAALRALSTEGIQRGHMKLHARNLAVMAGATGELINKVAERMIKEGKITFDNAKRILEELLSKSA